LGNARQTVRRAIVFLSVLVFGSLAVSMLLFVRGMATRRDPTSTSPHEAYRALIADPIPAAVTDLQGGGTTWQGYSISLRFRVRSLESAGFTQPPYVQADCAQVYSDLMANRLDPSPFIPEWKIPEVGKPLCLVWNELSNDWTRFGNHSVLYVNGWGFFIGRGS
jgi:hypothetical protein